MLFRAVSFSSLAATNRKRSLCKTKSDPEVPTQRYRETSAPRDVPFGAATSRPQIAAKDVYNGNFLMKRSHEILKVIFELAKQPWDPPKKLTVATACSGSEMVKIAIDAIREAATQAFGKRVPFEVECPA